MGCANGSATLTTEGNKCVLEYFDMHGRACSIRMLLWYAGVKYVDKRNSFQEFGEKKAKGTYLYGTLPVLYMPNGIELHQSNAIMRYIARVYRGKNNEILYPGKYNVEMSYEIDLILEESAEFMSK